MKQTPLDARENTTPVWFSQRRVRRCAGERLRPPLGEEYGTEERQHLLRLRGLAAFGSFFLETNEPYSFETENKENKARWRQGEIRRHFDELACGLKERGAHFKGLGTSCREFGMGAVLRKQLQLFNRL